MVSQGGILYLSRAEKSLTKRLQVMMRGQAVGSFPPINLNSIANMNAVLFLEVVPLLAPWSLVTRLTLP